jgi:hypothetical protein
VREVFSKSLPNYRPERIFCGNDSTDATLAILRAAKALVSKSSSTRANSARCAIRALTYFSDLVVPAGVGDFQLVDRRVVEAMRWVRDGYPFMRMMRFECGGRSVGVPYRWLARKKGLTKNRASALFDQGMNGFVSFTTALIRLGLFIGFILAFVSVLYALINVGIGLAVHRRLAEPGIMTLIVALFFFGGVQLSSLA